MFSLFAASAHAQQTATPGFDCNDPAWCLAVTPDGRIFLGNPTGFGGPGMTDTKKRLWKEKEIRSIVIRCLPPGTMPQRGFVCRGIDSFGNVYGGDSRDANDTEFFRKRS